jgi:hypothetical protein
MGANRDIPKAVDFDEFTGVLSQWALAGLVNENAALVGIAT